MKSSAQVTFEDWIYLQKCLKYEKLRITHGTQYADERQKLNLLSSMDNLHQIYYQEQLSFRKKLKERDRLSEEGGKTYRLETKSQAFLGDHFRYAEQLALKIRTNPDIFYFIASFLRQKNPGTELLVESIGYSFFVDLVHPENNEQDLLLVIHRLITAELSNIRGTGHVSNILKSNYLLDRLIYLYTKRKNQRKYMKLIFKRQLRDILMDQEELKQITMDPVKTSEMISATGKRHSMLNIPEVALQKGKPKKREERKSELLPASVSADEALSDPHVLYYIEHMSRRLINDCKELLSEIFNNVATMPYGIRVICLKIIEQSNELVPEAREADVFKLLGHILFYSWWIPAILDPINNDVVSNFVILPDTTKYLLKIVTVLKHICNNTRFAERAYRYINEFIDTQVPLMDEYFRKVVVIHEGHKNPLYASFQVGEIEELRTSNNYVSAKTQKHIEHMNEITMFKIITVVLSLNDLLFLSGIILEHESDMQEKDWKDLVRYAGNLKSAEQNYGLTHAVQPNERVFLYFCKKEWGESFDMENSYLASLTSAPSIIDKTLGAEERRLLAKCQEVARNLLINLDLSIFFDPGKEWNFIEIVEFVIQCSYLFESKTEQTSAISNKLLAQFLATYLPKLPHKYRIDNFKQLYHELMIDTEVRFQKVRHDANKNKKVLLLAINFIQKNVGDIKHEGRVQESAKRKLNFQDFIKKQQIHACILSKREGDQVVLQVMSVQDCPHSRVAYAHDLIKGRTAMQQEQKHVKTITQFFHAFVSRPEVVQSCASEEDPCRVREAFCAYMSMVSVQLSTFVKAEEETESTLEEIEKYITSQMHKKIFPEHPSDHDKALYRKTRELEWVKPEHLEIAPDQRNEDMWSIAIQQLTEINKVKTPAQKLDCMQRCMNIIVNVLSLVSKSSGVGADDSLPIMIYVVIKSQPKRLHSNLNYITNFRHPNKMIGLMGFVFQQFQSAAAFIESIDERSLKVSPEDFRKNCEECSFKLFSDQEILFTDECV